MSSIVTVNFRTLQEIIEEDFDCALVANLLCFEEFNRTITNSSNAQEELILVDSQASASNLVNCIVRHNRKSINLIVSI
ncbi:hypothetical protein GJ496_009177 [Pomphorhynchus laevis]|nr:hypothetical protein GJ496_009177 [Pomphorhynchus laevis]